MPVSGKGLTVEMVFSSDFRWIYALISAGEAALEDCQMEDFHLQTCSIWNSPKIMR